MHSILYMKLSKTIAEAVLLAAMASATPARPQDAPPQGPAQTNPQASHTPPDTAKMNALAHRVLAAGVKSNSLGGDGLQPWHLKADFQFMDFGMQKPASGTIEEWSMGQYQWRRTYSSPRAEWNGSEWSASLTQRYRAKPGSEDFQAATLNTRLAQPVLDALYEAPNFKPDYELNIKRATIAGLVLNCVSVANPGRYAENTNPDLHFCFDNDVHLRLITNADTNIEFDDIQPFQGRSVARDVKVMVKGQLISETKIKVLEPITADAELVKPSAKAAAQPYTVPPGQPQPESIFEVGANFPVILDDSGMPYRRSFPVPILIRKDGSVKPNPEKQQMWPPDLIDAIELALAKWKYKPYLVDGQPVEVEIVVSYNVDGKPFVPSYNRPKPKLATTSP
jgi:hypothetical protein